MKAIIIFLLLGISGYSYDLLEFNNKEEIFTNQSCAMTESCSLKEFKLTFNDYKIWVIDQYHFGSKIYASYTTDNIKDLEDYLIVQFIRGSQYYSQKKDDGDIVNSFSYVVDSFNETIPFYFTDWIIDSYDVDPMFWSAVGEDFGIRHYYYHWKDGDIEKSWGIEKPSVPTLYISHLPGQAFTSAISNTAVNVSLEFLTCIYKTKQVAPVNTRYNVKLGITEAIFPIHCFYWNSVFIYNHDTKQFERKFKNEL